MYIKNALGKLVYDIKRDLAANPGRIAKAQALTMDSSRPNMGLSGEDGLFASQEWWQSISDGRIEVRVYRGTIQRLYVAGQDSDDEAAEIRDFEYRCDDGTVRRATCLANEQANLELYRLGANVALAYALNRLKKQPAKDGGVNFAEVLLEIAIQA